MKIKVHQIPEEGVHLQGEDPASILDLAEPLFRFEKPVRYDLQISWVGERSILATGRLSAVVGAQCVQTLEWFDLPLEVADFKCYVESFRGDEVDLTQQIREDILLLLPANPVSPQAKPLKAEHPADPAGGSQVWGKLDKLKLK